MRPHLRKPHCLSFCMHASSKSSQGWAESDNTAACWNQTTTLLQKGSYVLHHSEGAAREGVRAPHDERLGLVALRGEGDDVVGALQLREGVVQRVPAQLHAAAAGQAVHHACMAK